jgi:LmbE family N-acetylglucosaminyl deacetylase
VSEAQGGVSHKGGETNVWILAHPDDEILGIHLIEEFSNVGNSVFYLCEGVPSGANFDAKKRYSEMQKAWRNLDSNYHLIQNGSSKHPRDGFLYADYDAEAIQNFYRSVTALTPTRIITTKLEGGHQDHDFAFILSRSFAKKTKAELVTFSTYSARNESRLFSTMSKDGNENRTHPDNFLLRFQSTRKAIISMLAYRSQWRTWVGLGPLVVFKYFLGKTYSTLETLSKELPEPRHYLYINRNKCPRIDSFKLEQNIESSLSIFPHKVSESSQESL